jgi:transcriptional repressor NrdR
VAGCSLALHKRPVRTDEVEAAIDRIKRRLAAYGSARSAPTASANG